MRLAILKTLCAALLFTAAAFAQQSSTMKGIVPADMNTNIDPCTDFYEYANGGWRDKNPIPPSQTRWSRRFAAAESTKDQLHDILEEVSKTSHSKGSVDQLIGDYYGSCMDEAKVNSLGWKPIEPLLKQIEAIKDRAALQRTIQQMHELAITVPFGLTSTPDNHDPQNVIADLYASGLGLPDRDYYLKTEKRFVDARAKYLEHVAKMFTLIGVDEATAKKNAQTVFDFEKKLAEKSLDNVALRDPAATDHKTRFADLQKSSPTVDWAGYFKAAKLSTADLNVQEPNFVKEVDRALREASIDDWKTYLKWHLVRSAANSLSQPFVDEAFAFRSKYLAGAKEMKPRWKRCVESTDLLLGEALGKKYTDKYFPPAAKARMQDLVKNLLLAMGDDIRQLEWMSDTTKKKALEKLATFNPKIGYPDNWKTYKGVNISRDSFWANAVSARKYGVEDDRFQIGKPVDRGRWGMTPPTSNAYYNPLLNEIVFPAGILQPPAFDLSGWDAINYGAIGVVIGHEISHGFDDQGAQYDAQGRLQNWWSESDLKQFQDRGACVVNQFDNYFIEPGVHHNGKLVLGESIGDLAGARIAYMAWKKALAKNPMPAKVDGFTPEQQFFIAWGQFRGDAIRIEQQRLMMQGDPHPTGKYRVNGPLSNLKEFQQAFGCKAGSPMVRTGKDLCEIW